MTNYSLRARMMILILAPTVLIGLLLIDWPPESPDNQYHLNK